MKRDLQKRAAVFFLPAFIFFQAIDCFPQTGLDSLTRVFYEEELPDSSKIDLSHDIGFALMNTSSMDSALKYAAFGTQASLDGGFKLRLARAQRLTGAIYQRMGKNEESLLSLLEALKTAEEVGDLREQASINNELGNLYLGYSDWENALFYYKQAYNLVEEMGLTTAQISIKANMGNIYSDMKDFDSAISLMKEAFLIDNEMPLSLRANIYLNLGSAFRQSEQYDSAFHYLNMSDSLSEAIQYDHLKPFIYYNLGNNHIAIDEMEVGKALLKNSVDWGKKLGTNRILADGTIDLVKILIDENNLPLANSLATDLFELIEDSGNHQQILNISRQLMEINRAFENPEKQLFYANVLISTEDSINVADARTKVLLARFEEIQEEQRLRFDEQFEGLAFGYKQNIRILISAFTLVMLVSSMWYWIKLKKIAKERQRLLGEIDELKQKETARTLIQKVKDIKAHFDKVKLEQYIEKKLNPTDWSILNYLYEEPLISNKDLADRVALSLEGTSSSLRKMYQLFEIETRHNKKMELLRKAILISTEE
ncbi:tetratricopeptide repeat protein [Roseivirga sp.]|uniref:tetratricopeptide repeat protein n=1 Tax=Roseivirga sp. TaxID=1964215 RepID=UPI003B520956